MNIFGYIILKISLNLSHFGRIFSEKKAKILQLVCKKNMVYTLFSHVLNVYMARF